VQLLKALTADVDIFYDNPVTRIDYHSDGVSVHTATHTFKGAVSTMPRKLRDTAEVCRVVTIDRPQFSIQTHTVLCVLSVSPLLLCTLTLSKAHLGGDGTSLIGVVQLLPFW
jgi:hypothetical protein